MKPLHRLCVAMLAGLWLGGCALQPGTSGAGEAGLPPGFVHLPARLPDAQFDIRYFGSDNFVGRPVAGYLAPTCILSAPAADALAAVQAELRAQGMVLKIFDCYRPQTAVNDFVGWGRDLADQRTKPAYYPEVPKGELFARGYIAEQSGHSRGSTVDLTVVVVDRARARDVRGEPLANGELDMGSAFDFFGVRSHTENPDVPWAVRHNRLWLRALMERHGFGNLPEEWWHFTLRDEPHPARYFDFPVR